MAKADPKDAFWSAWTTAWGPMGAVAGLAGLRRVVLPHYSMNDLCALLAWEHPTTKRDDGALAMFMELSRAYFNAQRVDFNPVPCDLPDEGSFFGQVYRACRGVAHGQTASYSGLAKIIGQDEAARAVATALGKNPTPLVVPCHRITYADGRPGGFSAEGGEGMKQRLLELERRTAK
jgi:methylated-DNA-[protein]-cysteine S-methyltransferase